MKKTFVIAEIGQAHDGSLGILHSYIDALSKTGVDAIKFQTHIANAESSQEEPFRVNFSYVDSSRYDYWKRMEFTKEQWKDIKNHCDDVGLEFMSTPFSLEAVSLLEEIGVNRYKISSGDVENFLLLERIAKTKKDVLISSGMSSFSELDRAVKFLDNFGVNLGIFQCTSMYPTPANKVGLNVIKEMQDRFDKPIGLSDHTGSIYASLAAVTLGASLIEVHAVFDKRMFGPDSVSSLEIDEIKQLVDGIRFIDLISSNPIDKENNLEFMKMNKIFGKSLAVNKALKDGEIITFEDLECKKPSGCGIPAKDYKNVIGKKLKVTKNVQDFILQEDIN